MIGYGFRRAVQQAIGGWKDWTPTYAASGSMTFTSVTTNVARYLQIGKTVFFLLYADGTTGGTASTGITFTLPVTSSNNFAFSVTVLPSGGTQIGGAAWAGTTTVVTVRKYDASNWALGAGTRIYVSGQYEAA